MGNRTGRMAVLGAWLTAGALCFASVAQAQTITIGNAGGAAGQQVTVSVTLTTTTPVAGTQNDISFAAPLSVAAKAANGKPDCKVNGDIDKGATSFAFRPNGCSGAACTSIRALVLSTDNVDAIPTGSVLYTCNVNIAADAANGDAPLTISGVILSDPAGNQVAGATGVSGTVTVVGGGGPTQTPTGGEVTPTPTVGGPTPTEVPAECTAPAIQLPSVIGQPGTQITFTAELLAGTNMVAGTQNDITFDPTNIPIAAKANGKPDCTVNDAIDKGATSFAFRPNGCTGTACTSIRALVLSTDNVAPIPDMSVLYTCKVNVAQSANTKYTLGVTGVIFSDPNGNQIPGAAGCNGAVVAGLQPTFTPTEAATAGPTNTPTATATATNTPVPVTPPTNTPTNTVKPTNTPTSAAPTPAPFDDDGGCNIGTTGSSNAGWLVLIPAIGLLVLRRRSR